MFSSSEEKDYFTDYFSDELTSQLLVGLFSIIDIYYLNSDFYYLEGTYPDPILLLKLFRKVLLGVISSDDI
jgi:hypothetical protein